MTAWVASRRATLLIPSGPLHDADRKHLHIVLNDPIDFGDGPRVLVVAVCSIPSAGGYDPSCTLFPGEHPFVVRDSVVMYRFCQIVDPASLEQKVDAGLFVAKPLLDEKVFAHVIQGLHDSPSAALKFKTFQSACGEVGA